ncbi:MAG: SO_0444 family Cu/Zn efflux transporter [Poseidonibacter sp.]|uniref:SO_0444 family Cu/Zn efflux transporter n=1 Tax=Poseidonibacter sp. TaxID=2321188 RepID=UPI00359CE528
MELMLSFADNFLVLLNAMSIYILVGLLFAGILKQLIPNDFVIKHLGKGNISSVLKATLFGIPLPVCSCSVIPLAQGLRKEGASKGAVQSFLISTPITGVDSILATFSFFGLIFTVFRVISSIIIAISVGLIQNFVDRDLKEEKENEIKVQSCCSNTSTCSSDTSKKEKFSIKKVFSYAYVTLFKDMAKTLFIGLLLGAAFTTFAPKEYTQLLFENEILTYIIIMLFAMPLYVCATASLPIAAALMLQGMSGGAAFIFLTAGPATSAITMSVVYKSLGKKALIVYVSTIAIMSFALGWFFDIYFGELNIISFLEDNDNNSIISNIASLIMLILMSYYLIKPRLYRNNNIKESDVKVQNDLKVNNKIDFKNATFKKRD